MTHIFRPDPRERDKWREQANKAARHLKQQAVTKPVLKLGFVFDDGVITVEVLGESVKAMKQSDLADHLFDLVSKAALSVMPSEGSA